MGSVYSDKKMTVLIIEDDPQVLESYSDILKSAGIKELITLEDGRNALKIIEDNQIATVVLDLYLPYISGTALLERIVSDYPHIPIIVVTAINDIETAVSCMKMGAFDYLVKPIDINRLVSSVKRALELYSLRMQVDSLKRHLLTDKLENESAFSEIITRSKKMRAIFHYIEAIAGTKQPVLITGETGVGKELIAKAIHTLSGRKGEFIAVNVSGLDDTIFSDTLFGHKKGAFTGAETSRDGLIVRASGGTLFLDEIGDLSETSQVKLLRLLQEEKFYPIGSDVPRQADVRIIVATNRDIHKLVEEGKFRKDLYYRLCTHHIHIPPLRERIEDIPLLLEYFLEEASKVLNKKKPTIPVQLETLLCTYHFPGNVRELRSMVFDAVASHSGGILSLEPFKASIQRHRTFGYKYEQEMPTETRSVKAIFGRFPTLKEMEELLIDEALRLADGNQGIAASMLGITRQALNKRLRRRQ